MGFVRILLPNFVEHRFFFLSASVCDRTVDLNHDHRSVAERALCYQKQNDTIYRYSSFTRLRTRRRQQIKS